MFEAPRYTRLIRWAFDRFYGEFAWTYDAVAIAVSAGHWRAWALSVMPLLGGRVLELGCGTGNLQLALAATAEHAGSVGIDRSPQMLALTRRKLRRAARPARLARGDARLLPFAGGAFDTVVATFPSEYIARQETLAEARRILRPGGRLVILLAAELDDDGLYLRLLDLAYRLTLQRSPRATPSAPATDPATTALLSRVREAGFAAHAERRRAPGGHAYLIIAETAG